MSFQDIDAFNDTDAQANDGLKNPMRFSIQNRSIDIENYLRHPDFDKKQVTEIEIQNNQLYIHWEWVKENDDLHE